MLDTTVLPGTLPGDLELARAAAGGSEDAYSELYRRHHQRTLSLCAKYVGTTGAPDLCQQAWIQVWRKIGQFRGDSAFTTWLHRLVTNQCLMHFRRPEVMHELPENDELQILFTNNVVMGSEFGRVSRVQRQLELEEAMEHLPQGYRKHFYLHDVLGYEHVEVAAILGCSPGTSKSQLHKARVRLAKLLRRKGLGAQRSSFIEERCLARQQVTAPPLDYRSWEEAVEETKFLEEDTYED